MAKYPRGGQWIDCYNQSTSDIAGTIIAGINAKNLYFIMEEIKHETPTRDLRDDSVQVVGHIERKGFDLTKRVYGIDGVAPTLNCQQGGGLEPKIAELIIYDDYNSRVRDDQDTCGTITTNIGNNAPRNGFKIIEPIVLGWTRDAKGNVIDRHPVEVANAVTAAKRDNMQKCVTEPLILQRGHGFNKGGVFDECPTITGSTWHHNNLLLQRKIAEHPNRGVLWIDGKAFWIRKLTPRECFRLMGVSDADIDTIQAAGISKSQQYKLAGNSIPVNTLAAIFRQLFIGNSNKVQQTQIF